MFSEAGAIFQNQNSRKQLHVLVLKNSRCNIDFIVGKKAQLCNFDELLFDIWIKLNGKLYNILSI